MEGLVRPLFEEGERRFIGHMRRYLAEKVEAGEVDDALAGCKYLPLAMENINSMLEVAAAARRLGKVDGAKRMFSSHLLPTEGMSSGLGEPPPELVRRKGVFLEMAKQAGPGLLASFLKELAGWFDAEIQRWQREDEEILDPRV